MTTSLPASRPPSGAQPGAAGRRLDDAAVADAAMRLAEAERQRTPIPQLSLQYPQMTIEDAYAVQRVLVDHKLAEGRVLIGRKIGLTSRPMQQALSINEPDYGAIFDDMLFEDGAEIPAGRFIRPRIEVELAFLLREPLRGPGCSLFDVVRATEFVTPALEILDARIQMTDPATGHQRTIVDTIADNAADAGMVLGGRPVAPAETDLRWAAAVLYRNGVVEESGVAAAVLNHPAHGVAWLANRLAPYGVGLDPGQVVLAGSFIRPVHADPGDVFHADFGPLGVITCRFARGGADDAA